MIYYLEFEKVEPEQIINQFIKDLKDFMSTNDLNSNERKLGQALIDLFENYNEIFIGNDNNKFNKNIILLSLREMTNMTTKEIRSALKKYKSLYFKLMKKFIDS